MRVSFTLALVLLLLFVPCTSSVCVHLGTVVSQMYWRSCSIMRRGAPDFLIRPFYQCALRTLLEYVNATHDASTLAEQVCIPLAHIHTMQDKLHLEAFQTQLAKTYINESRVFFLPFHMYTERQIGMHNATLIKAAYVTWHSVSAQLNRTVQQLRVHALSQLPDGVQFFFDPNERSNKQLFKLYEASNACMIKAPQLVAHVMRIITQLQMVRVVERKHSVQLLKHCTALLFSACRAHRKEGNQLLLPSFFRAFYDDAARHITAKYNMSSSQLPIISAWLIHKHLHDEIAIISSFKTFGSLRYARACSKTNQLQVRDLDERVFAKIQRITDQWHAWNASIMIRSLHRLASVRSSNRRCRKGSFFFKVTERETAIENCCVSICNARELIHRIGMSSKLECCRGCNEARCDVGHGSKLSRVSTVRVEPYGYSPSRMIAIVL